MSKTVINFLENSSLSFPEKIAFKSETSSVNYLQTYETAQKIGSYLIKKLNETTKQPVIVFVDSMVENIVSFFGVTLSGNFYVPIDINQPLERIKQIIDTTEAKVAIYFNSQFEKIKELKNIDFLKYDDIINEPINIDLLNKIRNRIIDTDPLYVMFTSGSTGKPKGVVINHLSVIDLVHQFKKEFLFDEKNIFGNQAPLDFDVSVKDIYSTIFNSSTMSIIPKVSFSFPTMLIEYLNKEKINTCIWATSVLRLVENLKGLAEEKPKFLQQVMFSGEVMPNKVLNYWRKNLPAVEYINLYGPTEITCNCSFYKVQKQYADFEILPIGTPFDNTEILILKDNRKEAKLNETGEICIRGSSLALGYYNNEKETSASFIENPLNRKYNDLIYKTGDLGYKGDDGLLYFVSRRDGQIKHMGHRIELGEIENHVNGLGYIDMCATFYDKKIEKIVLFYQAKENFNKLIYKDLLSKIPKYMIPQIMIQKEKMLMNKNAKIDRFALNKEYENNKNK